MCSIRAQSSSMKKFSSFWRVLWRVAAGSYSTNSTEWSRTWWTTSLKYWRKFKLRYVAKWEWSSSMSRKSHLTLSLQSSSQWTLAMLEELNSLSTWKRYLDQSKWWFQTGHSLLRYCFLVLASSRHTNCPEKWLIFRNKRMNWCLGIHTWDKTLASAQSEQSFILQSAWSVKLKIYRTLKCQIWFMSMSWRNWPGKTLKWLMM